MTEVSLTLGGKGDHISRGFFLASASVLFYLFFSKLYDSVNLVTGTMFLHLPGILPFYGLFKSHAEKVTVVAR